MPDTIFGASRVHKHCYITRVDTTVFGGMVVNSIRKRGTQFWQK